jgi:hypothetical protein
MGLDESASDYLHAQSTSIPLSAAAVAKAVLPGLEFETGVRLAIDTSPASITLRPVTLNQHVVLHLHACTPPSAECGHVWQGAVLATSRIAVTRLEEVLFGDAVLAEWLSHRRTALALCLLSDWSGKLMENTLTEAIPWVTYPQELAEWIQRRMVTSNVVGFIHRDGLPLAAMQRLARGDTSPLADLVGLWKLLLLHRSDADRAPF